MGVLGCVGVLLAGMLVRLTLGSFSIDGNAAAPIARGVAVPLDVRFTNRYDFPISVSDLTVTVLGVSAPDADGISQCTVDDFVVGRLASNVEIAVGARATRSLHLARGARPQVGILGRSAYQGACKGATLTLAYTASGKLRIL